MWSLLYLCQFHRYRFFLYKYFFNHVFSVAEIFVVVFVLEVKGELELEVTSACRLSTCW